jgi:hypothetical protein
MYYYCASRINTQFMPIIKKSKGAIVMLTVTRYINGVKVKDKDVKNYTIESDVISRTIAQVNKRLQTASSLLNGEANDTATLV